MTNAKGAGRERSDLLDAYERAVAIARETPLDTAAFRRNMREVERLKRALDAQGVPARD